MIGVNEMEISYAEDPVFISSEDENTGLIKGRHTREIQSDSGISEKNKSNPDTRHHRTKNPLLSMSMSTEQSDQGAIRSVKGEWIHIDLKLPAKTNERRSSNKFASKSSVPQLDKKTGVNSEQLPRHDPVAFLKVCETLSFLSRDAAHITPANFDSFIHCLLIMIQASLNGGNYLPIEASPPTLSPASHLPPSSNEKHHLNLLSPSSTNLSENKSPKITSTDQAKNTPTEHEKLANCYADASLQLLGMCNTLYAKSASIFKDWEATTKERFAAESDPIQAEQYNSSWLWLHCWKPLMQAMGRLSCDCRRTIRIHALESLSVSFRLPELSELKPHNWEDCFCSLLFPISTSLLENISPMDPIGVEETRIRIIQLISKTFLSHLNTISQLNSFPTLFRDMFCLMDKFKSAGGDLLDEVVEESMKNVILVCENFGLLEKIKRVEEFSNSENSCFQEIVNRLETRKNKKPEIVSSNVS